MAVTREIECALHDPTRLHTCPYARIRNVEEGGWQVRGLAIGRLPNERTCDVLCKERQTFLYALPVIAWASVNVGLCIPLHRRLSPVCSHNKRNQDVVPTESLHSLSQGTFWGMMICVTTEKATLTKNGRGYTLIMDGWKLLDSS